MKTILVTGASGFLGKALVNSLSRDYRLLGLEKHASDQKPENKIKLFSSSDINIDKIFTNYKIDVIIHTATLYNINGHDYSNLIEANISLPVKLLSYAEKYHVKTFINCDSFFSSLNIEYEHLGFYTITKKESLAWLKRIARDTKLINMKIFHMYGPGDNQRKFVNWLMDALKNNKDLELTLGEQIRDFIHVSDVIAAFICVITNLEILNKPYIEFEVGTGQGTSIRKLVEMAHIIANSSSKLKFGALSYRDGEPKAAVADPQNLRIMGWRNSVNLTEGLKSLLV